MLKNVKYRNVCQKFHRGINRIDNEEIIDVSITSFGGFTDSFSEGVGRRVDLQDGEIELSVNTVAEINDKVFHFTRCYTDFQSDTKELDKKQDIVKYGKELDENIDKKKFDLPVIAYYSNNSVFEDDCVSTNHTTNNVLNNRSLGYSNCLIVKDKFSPTQRYFCLNAFLNWQKQTMNVKDCACDNFLKALDNIKNALYKTGYNGLIYNDTEECLMTYHKNKWIKISDLDKDVLIYIAIIFDLNMRCIMLNPNHKNPFGIEGCVGITYRFLNKNKLFELANIINKQFPRFQILI